MQKCILFLIVSTLLALVVRLPVSASDVLPQPEATAEAAQRRAWSAQATANAAWARATAESAAATAAARATATAHAQGATATAAAATARAEATRQAIEARATRQALDVAATRAAYELAVTATAVTALQRTEATAQAATATRQAHAVRLAQLNLERHRRLQPLILYGPWLVLVLSITLVVWASGRLIPLLESRLPAADDVVEGEFYPDESAPPPVPLLLLPERAGTIPCVLRPIAPGQSRRPVESRRAKYEETNP